MQLAKIFYGFGIIFAIATILFFTWEYIISFPPAVKSIILICLTIILFFIGEALKEVDK